MEKVWEIPVHCPDCGQVSGWALSCDFTPRQREDLLCYCCKKPEVTMPKESPRILMQMERVVCAKHGDRLWYYVVQNTPPETQALMLSIRVEPCPTCLGDAVADVLVGPNPDDTDRRHP